MLCKHTGERNSVSSWQQLLFTVTSTHIYI